VIINIGAICILKMQMRYLKSINKKIINNTMTKKKKEQRPSNDLQNITQKTEQIVQNES
jgi:hypothetical protein